MNLYPLARVVFPLLTPLVTRRRVEGREHVPEKGPFILAINHNSLLDAVFAQVACPRTVHTMTCLLYTSDAADE